MYLGSLGEIDPGTITGYEYSYSGTGNMCNMWGLTSQGNVWQGLVPCPPGLAPAVAPTVLVDSSRGLDVNAPTRVASPSQESPKLAPVNASPLPPAPATPAPSGVLPTINPMPGETGGGSNLTPVLEPGDQTKVAGGTTRTGAMEGDSAPSNAKMLILAAAAVGALILVKRKRQ